MLVIFLVPYPIATAPSQRFRLEQYLQILENNDGKYFIKPFLKQTYFEFFSKTNGFIRGLKILLYLLYRLKDLLTLTKADFVFIHREASPIGPPILEWLVSKVLKKKIIYDLDDPIWLEDPSEKGTLIAKLKWKSKIASICRWSYKVSAGNEYLATYARQFNTKVTVNPTTIDTEELHNPRLYKNEKKNSYESKKICIGWTGSHSTLHYLNDLSPVFSKLEQKFSFKLRVIADKKPTLELKSLEFVQWNKETEIQDLMDIDIGIMPLTNDEWSKGKCGFKALQYIALEKPAVVSPVGVNSRIIEHGVTGYHCRNEEEWIGYLSILMAHPEQCKVMGKKGRAFVQKYYSVDANAANFLSLFDLP